MFPFSLSLIRKHTDFAGAQVKEMPDDSSIKAFSSNCRDLQIVVLSMHAQRASRVDEDMPVYDLGREMTPEEKAVNDEARNVRVFILNEKTWEQDGFFVVSLTDYAQLLEAMIHTEKCIREQQDADAADAAGDEF